MTPKNSKKSPTNIVSSSRRCSCVAVVLLLCCYCVAVVLLVLLLCYFCVAVVFLFVVLEFVDVCFHAVFVRFHTRLTYPPFSNKSLLTTPFPFHHTTPIPPHRKRSAQRRFESWAPCRVTPLRSTRTSPASRFSLCW